MHQLSVGKTEKVGKLAETVGKGAKKTLFAVAGTLEL